MLRPAFWFLISINFASANAAIDGAGPALTTFFEKAAPNVICEGECPDSVAVLRTFSVEPRTWDDLWSLSQHCMASLISPDEVITNWHCIPPATALQYVRLIFPKTATREAEVRGVTGVVRQGDKLKEPLADYAILKLDRPLTRKFAEFSKEKLDLQGQYTHFTYERADLPDGTYGEKLRPFKCGLQPDINVETDKNITLAFAACPAKPGTSGGPVFNADGKQVAVRWGGRAEAQTFNLNCLSPGCKQLVESAIIRLSLNYAFQENEKMEETGETGVVRISNEDSVVLLMGPYCLRSAPPQSRLHLEGLILDPKLPRSSYIDASATIPYTLKDLVIDYGAFGEQTDIKVSNRDNSLSITYTIPRCKN